MAGSAAFAVVAPGAIAGAKGAKPDKVVCTGFSGTETSQSITGCTGGPAASGTSVPGPVVNNSGTATVTWSDGNTSLESFSYTSKSGKADKCSPGAGETNVVEVKEKGSVTGGTETALTGGKVKSTVCVFSGASGITLSVYPGSVTDF